jgi:hypothetical protein
MAKDDRGNEVAEWIALGQRLRSASPGRYRKLVAQIKNVVEGQETLAAFDDQLVLRGRRPTKRYCA